MAHGIMRSICVRMRLTFAHWSSNRILFNINQSKVLNEFFDWQPIPQHRTFNSNIDKNHRKKSFHNEKEEFLKNMLSLREEKILYRSVGAVEWISIGQNPSMALEYSQKLRSME